MAKGSDPLRVSDSSAVTAQQPPPFFTLPWQAGITAWSVIFGGIVYELVVPIFTQSVANPVTIAILAVPIVVALVLAVIEMRQVRATNSERPHLWHLGAIALGLLIWQLWPRTPSILLPIHGAHDTCVFMFQATPACIALAKSAYLGSNLSFWITGGLIVALIPLARYSKIGAWTAVPIAFAGSQLSSHFLQLMLHHYHVTGF